MRIALALVSVFAISCSTSNKYYFYTDGSGSHEHDGYTQFVDDDDDGLPDHRIDGFDDFGEPSPAAAEGFDEDGHATLDLLHVLNSGNRDATLEIVYVDEDGNETREVKKTRIARPRIATQPARDNIENRPELERALEQLQKALDEVRRALR